MKKKNILLLLALLYNSQYGAIQDLPFDSPIIEILKPGKAKQFEKRIIKKKKERVLPKRESFRGNHFWVAQMRGKWKKQPAASEVENLPFRTYFEIETYEDAERFIHLSSHTTWYYY